MADGALWQLTATWMSGKTWQFEVSLTSTVGELRRRIMLASGGMRKITLIVDNNNATLEGHTDTEQLTHFAALGLAVGAHLTVVVSEAPDESAAWLLTDAELTAFVRPESRAACSELQSMSLDGCKRIGDEGLRALSAGCPNLQHINLQMCKQISDEGLRALSMGCPKMEHIEVSDCEQISDDGLRALIAGCPNLQYIKFTSLSGVAKVYRPATTAFRNGSRAVRSAKSFIIECL